MNRYFIWIATACLIASSCSRSMYSSNGESIYKSGKNLSGKSLFDKQNSRLRIFKSCKGCHGSSGRNVRSSDVSWAYLSDSSMMQVPYTKELFFRFLDEDLKSDGTKAKTGVHFVLNDEEKADLIEYLKKLK